MPWTVKLKPAPPTIAEPGFRNEIAGACGFGFGAGVGVGVGTGSGCRRRDRIQEVAGYKHNLAAVCIECQAILAPANHASRRAGHAGEWK